MKAVKIEFQLAQPRQHRRHPLGVDAELFGAAAHLHARRFQFEIRIDANRHFRHDAERLADHSQSLHFSFGLHVQHHAGGHRAAQIGVALAGTGEADQAGRHRRVEGDFQFTAGSDVDAVDQGRHVLYQRRHGIGLHRIVQVNRRRQVAPQQRDPLAQGGAVVGIEGRAADALGQLRERHAAHLQDVVDNRKLHQRRVWRTDTHAALPAKIDSSSVLSILRSILPFGLRGSGPGAMMILAGSI